MFFQFILRKLNWQHTTRIPQEQTAKEDERNERSGFVHWYTQCNCELELIILKCQDVIFLSGIRNHCILLIINKVTKTISFNDGEQLSDLFGILFSNLYIFVIVLMSAKRSNKYLEVCILYRIVVAVRAVLVAETSA